MGSARIPTSPTGMNRPSAGRPDHPESHLLPAGVCSTIFGSTPRRRSYAERCVARCCEIGPSRCFIIDVATNFLSTKCLKLVGVKRFELLTPGTQNRCATRLRHTPREGLRYPPNRPFLLSHQPVGRGSLCTEMREPCCENQGFDATRMSSCKDLVFAIHGWSPTSSDRNPSGRVGFYHRCQIA